MNIFKVFGKVIEYKSGGSARIEVLSFRKNGEAITKSNEIRLQFPPHGCVFAPIFFEKFDFEVEDLVEFTTSAINSNKGENADTCLMDISKPCKRIGFPVFPLSKEIFINELSINQPLLKELIRTESSHFYIRNNGFYYGPFKSLNNEITPKAGTTVNKYQNKHQEVKSNNETYLLFEPDVIIAKVDCMTSSQLAVMLRDIIKKQKLEIDINLLKSVLELQHDELEQARIRRLVTTIEGLEVSLSEFKILSEASEKFQSVYLDTLKKFEEEIKNELLEPFNYKKIELEKEIKALYKENQTLKHEQENLETLNQLTQEEYNRILNQKEKIIQDIRIHALINQSAPVQQSKITTYEEQIFFNDFDPYKNVEEYIASINQSINTNENGKSKFAYNAIYQLKDYKCILSDNVETVLQIAKLTNNCKVYIQQVEPDWLKFQSFYDNGLRDIWSSAQEHPDIIHFFILEDINLASIECYGKPILDLISNVRYKLPGLNSSWPENLWIYGIPLQQTPEHDFGLPLIKNTFKNWGYFPKTTGLTINNALLPIKKLDLPSLKNHQVIVSSFAHNFFPEL